MLPELQRRMERLDASRAAFLATAGRFSDEQRVFRPAPDAWSALEVTEHLVLAEEKSVLGMETLTPPSPTVTPLAHLRMALVRLVMRTDLRVKVPTRRVLPTGSIPLEELSSRWMASRERLSAFLEGITAADLGLARFRHPIGGWVGASVGAAFLADHIDHHHRQLGRIARSGGFTLR